MARSPSIKYVHLFSCAKREVEIPVHKIGDGVILKKKKSGWRTPCTTDACGKRDRHADLVVVVLVLPFEHKLLSPR